MLAENIEAPPAVKTHRHAAFFRQSGWMMTATVIGGAMMLGVHFLSKIISKDEYSIFGAMVALISCVPTMPLQMVFTQQTAMALATNRERQLASMIRQAWLWSFLLWFVGATGAWMYQGQNCASLGAFHSVHAVSWHLVAMLFALWQPLFMGVLQGRQNFFWFGWVYILGGVIRVGAAALIVLALHSGANGMMIGVVAGLAITIIIPIWQVRDLLLLPAERFAVRQLLKQVVPLMLGFGALQFLFMADTMFVKSYFTGEQTASYVAAGTSIPRVDVARGTAGRGYVSKNCS